MISSATAQDLGLITLHVNKINITKDSKLDAILSKHERVFQGMGKLKGETVKLNIDRQHEPKAQPQRRIPYHIREKVERALTELEKDDIIERVPEDIPTPWISPIVSMPKTRDEVRICVDMRLASLNDSNKYTPNFATIAAPLRELTKNNTKFQ